MKLDMLVFAAHPDDAELGCAGTIMKHIALGYKVGIIDLTKGELGTRGTVETREQEAKTSASIMGLQVRENLGMRDGFFQNDEEHQLQIIRIIRKYQPSIVLANAYHDRHPDHGRGSDLINDACFLAGLIKIETSLNEQKQQAWRPSILLHYIQDRYIQPDILIDITDYMDRKIEAIKAFKTQFYDPKSAEPETYISSLLFLEGTIARARELGRYINANFAEGFTSRKLLGVEDLFYLK